MQALGEGGKVTHLVGRDETSARRIMQAFFSHKDAHLAAAGAKVGFDNSIARGFFERVCLDGLEEGRAAMELHALCVNDRIVSTFGGGAHLGRFHAMFESAEIDPDVAATSIFKSKQPRVRKAIEGIIDEQEARAKASWNKLTHQQIYGLLVGTHSPAGNWEFLNGELTSLKVDSVTFKGHCVLTELTLNLVGKSAGARTIKIRAAFTVFKDGGIGLIGTN